MLAMIGAFQSGPMQVANPDRRIDPDGSTLAALRKGMKPGFSAYKLRATMTGANAVLVARYAPPIQTQMAAGGIDTPQRMAHFLAQVGHESGDLRYSEEIASGAAYEGRSDLGNTQPGDGVRFKGRGLIQLTGRANYVAYGKARNRDFVSGDNYKLIATDPLLAVDVACWFWMRKKLNALADQDDIEAITRAINGGLNGLEDRAAHLGRAKGLLVS